MNLMKIKPIVKQGDKVRCYSYHGIYTGTVEKSEILYGGTYATIIPDGKTEPVYLFHGAVEGFEPLSENVHPWSPLGMGRMRMLARQIKL